MITSCMKVNLGPTVADRIKYITPTTEIGRSAEVVKILDKKLKVELIYDDGKENPYVDDKDIGGWIAWRPDIAKVKGLVAARVANETICTVALEKKLVDKMRAEGKAAQETDKLDIVGWYVVPPKKKKESSDAK